MKNPRKKLRAGTVLAATLCAFWGAPSVVSAQSINSSVQTAKSDMGWMQSLPGQTGKPERQGKKYLKLDFSSDTSFETVATQMTEKFGPANETFTSEKVWYLEPARRGRKQARFMTVQLKYSETGQLVLLADSRLAKERGGPLMVGDKDRYNQKSLSAAPRQKTKRRKTRKKPVAKKPAL